MKKEPSEIGIGTDIEVFLFDNKLKQIVPCVGILPGTKEKPYKPGGLPKGYGIQEDNVMAEFNVPATHTYGAFTKTLSRAVLMVSEELVRRHKSQYSLYTKSHYHRFTPDQLSSAQAQTIGCEPDFDAYNGGVVRSAIPAPNDYRSCGGHIHLGGDFKCPDFVAALFAELFIGVRCRQVIAKKDPRAKWYGQPGVFRPKPYGVEYRTPNNSWVWDLSNREYIAEAALRCARFLTTSEPLELQTMFRAIPWVQVREFMFMDTVTKESSMAWHDIMNAGQVAGVPL